MSYVKTNLSSDNSPQSNNSSIIQAQQMLSELTLEKPKSINSNYSSDETKTSLFDIDPIKEKEVLNPQCKC